MSRSRRWRTPESAANRHEARAASTARKMDIKTDYSAWSQESLIERVTQLEKELSAKNRSLTPSAAKKIDRRNRVEKPFDPSKYNTRFIALKLAYLGKRYNGYEYTSGNPTPLPTIEEEVWKALKKTRLIFPSDADMLKEGEISWEGTDYSKCGRTDKGVSAFGQVIGIRVRSNRPLRTRTREIIKEDETERDIMSSGDGADAEAPKVGTEDVSATVEDVSLEDLDVEPPFDPIADEIPYATLLNKVLPPDIRILAWCPNPDPDFSARFSCRERRYRYFFTQPAFSPLPHNLDPSSSKPVKDGWLDIDAMRQAAKMYEGVHDFRNLCKVDGGKQITNFERRIFHADIEKVDDQSGGLLQYINGPDFAPQGAESRSPRIYTFTLHGSAFLWHQVRHMIAILFLVGQGLEKPSLVAELLDVKKNPRRPNYEMATDTPLVLWDCIFPAEDDPDRKNAIEWLYVGDGPRNAEAKYGLAGLMDSVWGQWRERKVDEILAGALLDVVSKQGGDVKDLTSLEKKKFSQKVFDGGDTPRQQGAYIPVMKKALLESVDVINEKYALRKGFEGAEDMKIQGFRRENKLAAKVAAG